VLRAVGVGVLEGAGGCEVAVAAGGIQYVRWAVALGCAVLLSFWENGRVAWGLAEGWWVPLSSRVGTRVTAGLGAGEGVVCAGVPLGCKVTNMGVS